MADKIRLREIKGEKGGQFASPDELKPSSSGKVKSLYVETVEKKDPKKKG